MPAANNARFLINLAGMQHLSVLGFSGTEALDEVYEIIINIIAPQPLDASLLQQPVCLTLLSQYSDSNTALPADQHPRYINGVVDTLTQTGYQADSGYEYTITVVPQLALLKHRRRYQIFQQQNVPAIVGQLLKEAGITAVKQQLQGSYTARDYCVQYGESDLEFIQRILSEAGIFFYFEHTATDHTLVLQDNMMQSQDLTPLMYHPHTGQVPDGSVVTQWTVTHKVTPGVTSGRTYDFTRPHTKEESFEVTHSDQKNTTMLQQDQGLQPVQDDLTKPNASRRQQEQAERDQIVVKGKTDSIECLPGYYLLLKDHPDASNNTLWLLTKVTHKGMQPQVKEAYASQRESGSYQATFEAVHQHLSWRPSIIKKPQQTGPQTAIVTGPEGQEIFTDNYGRVKVQFHWDRKAQGDDKSSAWLRVMQQWAGAGYGTFSLPRVGHEVLVSFLNHDIDQPVITGSLHNGTNKPAYSLPDNKTRSGIKTLSSPGGNTDNELRFDDKQGQEQIYIHAGKDFAQQIDNDQHIVVNNDHHHTTKNNHYQQVQGEQHTTVNKGSFTTVQGSVNETVQGSVQTKVAKSHLLNAGKTIHVKAGQHVVFNAGKTLTLKAGGKFLTINSNGVSVSSGIKISSGGSSGAADAAPKTAAMPGSVDKAGFGQTPIPESAQTPEVLTALAKGQVLTADFKRSQFVATSFEDRQHIMQSVCLNKSALTEGTPHLLPVKQSAKAVAEYAGVAPALKELTDVEQNLANYLKTNDAYFWSGETFTCFGNSGATACENTLPAKVKTQGVCLLVEDAVGMAQDMQTGALTAKGAQEQWQDDKTTAPSGKTHTNSCLQQVANIIEQFTCVSAGMITQAVEGAGVSSRTLPKKTQESLLTWAKAMYQHVISSERAIANNAYMTALASGPGVSGLAKIQVVLAPQDPDDAITALSDHWPAIKTTLTNDIQQLVQLRLHGEGNRDFSTGVDDEVDYHTMLTFAAKAEKQLTIWQLVKNQWVTSLIQAIASLEKAQAGYDLTDKEGLIRARQIVVKTLITLQLSAEGQQYVAQNILVKGSPLLRVLAGAEPEPKLIEGPGSYKEWPETIVINVFQDELASGFVKASAISAALAKGARLPSDEVLESKEVKALSTLLNHTLASFLFLVNALWEQLDDNRAVSFAGRILQSRAKGVLIWLASALMQLKSGVSLRGILERNPKLADLDEARWSAERNVRRVAELIEKMNNPSLLNPLEKSRLRLNPQVMPERLSLGQVKQLSYKGYLSKDVQSLLDVTSSTTQLPQILDRSQAIAKDKSQTMLIAVQEVSPIGDANESASKLIEKAVSGLESAFMLFTVFDLISLLCNYLNKGNVTTEERFEFAVKTIGDSAYLLTTLLGKQQKSLQPAFVNAVTQKDKAIVGENLSTVIRHIAALNALSMISSGLFGVYNDVQKAHEAKEQGQPASVADLYDVQVAPNGLFALVGVDNLALAISKRSGVGAAAKAIARWQGTTQIGDGALAENVSGKAFSELRQGTLEVVDTVEEVVGTTVDMIAAEAWLGPLGAALGTITLAINFFIYEATLDKLTLWAKNSAWGNGDTGWHYPEHLYHLAPVVQAPVLNTTLQAELLVQEEMTMQIAPFVAVNITLPGYTPDYASNLQRNHNSPALSVMVEVTNTDNWANQLKDQAVLMPRKPLTHWYDSWGNNDIARWLDITGWLQPYITWQPNQPTVIINLSALPYQLQNSLKTLECRLQYRPPLLEGFVTEKDGDKTLSGNKVTVWQIQQGQQGVQAAMSDEDTEALKPESSALAWQSLPLLPALEV